jgi:hypothetical protein
LNAFANGTITLSVSQPTITAGDTISVNWNRVDVQLVGDFTIGLYQTSVPGLDNPLTTTVVPDSAGNSGVAHLESSPNALGYVSSAAQH